MGIGRESRTMGPPRCWLVKCRGDQRRICNPCRVSSGAWVWLNTVLRRFYIPPCRNHLFIRGCQYSSEVTEVLLRPQAQPHHEHAAVSSKQKLFSLPLQSSVLMQSPWASQCLKGGAKALTVAMCSAQIEPWPEGHPCHGAFYLLPKVVHPCSPAFPVATAGSHSLSWSIRVS